MSRESIHYNNTNDDRFKLLPLMIYRRQQEALKLDELGFWAKLGLWLRGKL